MIAILLSTYNGEKYIREQIDSLLNQTIENWFLVVRDDGSSDKTVEILKGYSSTYPTKIYIDESVCENLGAGKSFMHLLEISIADYYMFCDQDDVWKPNKICNTLKKMQTMEREYGLSMPIGVFTDLEVVDENLNLLMPSLWKGDNRHPEYVRNFYKQWTNRHATYGCTMMINKSAKQIVLPYNQFEGIQGGHDNWIEYILIKKGIFDYIDECSILYRQHRNNAAGVRGGYSHRKEILKLLGSPLTYLQKIKKDYKRARKMPFKVSFFKVLAYRLIQLFQI